MESIQRYWKRTDKMYLLLCLFSSAMAVLALSSWAAKQGSGFAVDELTGQLTGIGDYRRAVVQAGAAAIGILVGLMDISTANNTVAIVMAGPIAKEIATEYGISPKRSASLLDTFSCIFQGIIPYGAQMLVALSTCATLGYAVSAFDIIPLLFYPFLLCLSSLLFILFDHQ